MHARSTRIDSGWLAAKFSARLLPAACVLESDRSKAVSDSYKIYFSHFSQFCDHRYTHDPLAALTSPRPRRAPGVRPHPHDLLQEQPVSSGMFDERAGDNAAPKLSREGYRWGPFPAGGSRYPFVVVPERHICGLLIRDVHVLAGSDTDDSSYWLTDKWPPIGQWMD